MAATHRVGLALGLLRFEAGCRFSVRVIDIACLCAISRTTDDVVVIVLSEALEATMRFGCLYLDLGFDVS